MMIDLPTKRRWIVSVLEAVAETTDGRPNARLMVKQPLARRAAGEQKGFALRLKAATRPLAEAAH